MISSLNLGTDTFSDGGGVTAFFKDDDLVTMDIFATAEKITAQKQGSGTRGLGL